jgi:biopolymer transport protein ExbB
MDANLIHDIIFYVMYAALAIAVVILVERGLYFRGPSVRLCALKALTPDVRRASDLPESLTGRSSLPLTLILPVLEKKQTAEDREAMSDLIDAQYLLSKPQMSRGLWMLETVVTAAPLLGLLGTILGIMDTFKALSASGVSDASMVSAGMGTALYHRPGHCYCAAVPGGQ